MFSTPGLSRSRKRVFDSVFPSASLKDIAPTPTATPLLGSTGPGQAFGFGIQTQPASQDRANLRSPGGHDFGELKAEDSAPEQVIWNRAWHTATSSLSFPDHGFQALTETALTENGSDERWLPSNLGSREAQGAFTYLLSPSSQGRKLRVDSKQDDLLEWYGNEIRRHFLTNFRTGFVKLLEAPGAASKDGLLTNIIDCLIFLQRLYFAPLLKFLIPQLDATQREAAFSKLRQNFHSLVAYSLPYSRIADLFEIELTNETLIILGVSKAANEGLLASHDEEDYSEMDIDRCSTVYRIWKDEVSETARIQSMTDEDDPEASAARQRLLPLLQGLQEVGLGGNRAQKIFAGVMNNIFTQFVKVSYAGQWDAPSLAVQHVRLWTENVFARLVVQALHILQPDDAPRGGRADNTVNVSLVDVAKWQEIGIARLGALRTTELFDVIVDWDVSRGAIEDLKHYTTNPGARFYLANTFIGTLHRRLLQPGASTVQILQLYISIIKAFDSLDPKGVLLDRIARPIRKYLRDREDTIKVIVGGLLADNSEADGGQTTTTSSTEGTLTELSAELSKAHELTMKDSGGELDWDDMNWTPDPIDAAPDYKKSKGADVIGSLISLFDSKEAFVKELQAVLSERLLRKRADYDQEMSVLELLKVRFGDSTLQACEVMLRDVFDSKRVDTVVRNDQGLAKKTAAVRGDPFVTPDRRNQVPGRPSEDEEIPELHAKILSRFFWPAMQDQPFKVPEEVASLQQRYSQGFESLKQSRKLTWLNAMGQVTVELDLEDRVFTDEVTTWQATVIYAFQSDDTNSSHGGAAASGEERQQPITRTISELSEQLEMSAALVRSACLFWVSRRILTEVQRDQFRVLEVLPTAADESGDVGGTSSRDTARDTDAATASNVDNDETAAASAAAAAADAAAAEAAKESANALAMEKMNIYWQFIVGMLTNQGAMPLQRIVMMLKIAVPGGFPFSNEELREFLAGMVSQGKLEIVNGGNYKIKHS